MRRVFFLILSLAAAAMMALLLEAVAQDAGTANVVHTNALSVAGLLFAAVAAGNLLKRR